MLGWIRDKTARKSGAAAAPPADTDGSWTAFGSNWNVQSLCFPLCFDEIDEGYFEVVVPQLPAAWDWNDKFDWIRLGFGPLPVARCLVGRTVMNTPARIESPLTCAQAGSVSLDEHGRVTYRTRMGLLFTAVVYGFSPLASGDVVGMGLDNAGELYVTRNGMRCHISPLPRVTLVAAHAQQACARACNVRFALASQPFRFDPSGALRTPANTPWMRDERDCVCHVTRLPLAVLSLILCEYLVLSGEEPIVPLVSVCKMWHAAIVQNNTLWRSVYTMRWSRAMVGHMRPASWYQLAKRRAALGPADVAIENCDEAACPQLFHRLPGTDEKCRQCHVCHTDVPRAASDWHLRHMYDTGRVVRVAYAMDDLLANKRGNEYYD